MLNPNEIRIGPWLERSILRVYQTNAKNLTREQLEQHYAESRLLAEVLMYKGVVSYSCLGMLPMAREVSRHR
jgi:hypothetical protein